jgi:antitoxin component YwqK of YwqJK toxin-antitoxin module
MKLIKTIFLFVIVTLLITSCTKTVNEFYPSGRIKSQIQTRNGKEHGVSKYYNETYGTVILEVKMKNGMKNGLMRRSYFNGNLEYEANYVKDKLDGVERMFSNTGQLIVETTYKNGIKEGPYKSWHENGVQFAKGAFKNDLQDGKWEFYDERELLMGEATFSQGTGEQMAYDFNGVLERRTIYKKGMKDGEETHYTPNGEVLKVILYKEDHIVEVRENLIEKN